MTGSPWPSPDLATCEGSGEWITGAPLDGCRRCAFRWPDEEVLFEARRDRFGKEFIVSLVPARVRFFPGKS